MSRTNYQIDRNMLEFYNPQIPTCFDLVDGKVLALEESIALSLYAYKHTYNTHALFN